MARFRQTSTPTSTRRAVLALIAAFGALGGGYAVYAQAQPSVPPPSISGKPANPTTQTSASFSFSDSKSGVNFQCSLDGSQFAACSSPTNYPGPLSGGSHTFQVRARTTSGDLSSPASETWLIDRQAPSAAVSFPVDGGSYNAGGWSAGCPGGAGICGTASDPSGVSSVAVSIRQGSGNWWGGSSFNKTSEFFITATGTTKWRYALPMPAPDGSYTAHVRSTDNLGNTTTSGSYATSAFAIDTQAPPAPTITAKPPSLSGSDGASFSFGDAESGVTFQCKLDGGQFSPCSSPKSYSHLSDGSHSFQVNARDAAGNVSGSASWTWTVATKPPPEPKITQHPTDPTGSSSATFTFTDGQSGVSFECRLDGGGWTACTSPTSFGSLGAGEHNFYVRALDAVGNRSEATRFEWDVTQQTGQPFTISGNAPNPLYPGAPASPIAVTLTNPNSAPIYVTSLTASLGATGLPAGCSSAWFQIAQSSVSTTTSVQVPANGSVTLPAQGASAPSIQLVDSHTAQDACQGARLTITYTGSAHS